MRLRSKVFPSLLEYLRPKIVESMHSTSMKNHLTNQLLIILLLCCSICAQTPREGPKLLSVREQQAVRESWLKKRLDTMLLPMMRQQKIDMWIVVNEEFHPDPVTEYIAPPLPYVGRRDFFIFAAIQMRRILIDHARRCNAKMHAGEHPANKVDLDDVSLFSEQRSKELLTLDEACERLEKQFPISGRIVELRFFGGCTREETAQILNISVDDADREWEFAKRWLRKELKTDSGAVPAAGKKSSKGGKNAG